MTTPSDVHRVALAPDLTIARALTGLWQVADLEKDGTPLDPERAADAMAPYADAGLTSFDMADHYGSAEVIAGTFRRRRAPGEVQLLTKWVPEPGPVTRATVQAAVDRARSRLGVERIDLLQFHTWAYDDPSWMDALFHLQDLKQEGAIGALGLTNFDAAHLRVACAAGVEIATNQVAYSLLDRRAAGDMIDVCARYGVQILGYGTVAGGLLSERWLGAPDPAAGGALETWSHMKYHRFVEAAGGWGVFQDAAARREADRRRPRRRHGDRRLALRARAAARRRRHRRRAARQERPRRGHPQALLVRADRRGPRRAGRRPRESDAAARRQRRRVPQAALPDRLGRPEPPRHVASRRPSRRARGPAGGRAPSPAPSGRRAPASRARSASTTGCWSPAPPPPTAPG